MKRLFLPFTKHRAGISLALTLALFVLVGASCWTTTVNVPDKVGSDSVGNTNTATSNDNTNVAAVAEATLTITSGTGDPKVFVHEIEEGMTAQGLLEHLQEEGELTVTTKQYDFGDLITGIDGVDATDTIFWSFYVNGELASVGAGTYVLQADDAIEFKYQTL